MKFEQKYRGSQPATSGGPQTTVAGDDKSETETESEPIDMKIVSKLEVKMLGGTTPKRRLVKSEFNFFIIQMYIGTTRNHYYRYSKYSQRLTNPLKTFKTYLTFLSTKCYSSDMLLALVLNNFLILPNYLFFSRKSSTSSVEPSPKPSPKTSSVKSPAVGPTSRIRRKAEEAGLHLNIGLTQGWQISSLKKQDLGFKIIFP